MCIQSCHLLCHMSVNVHSAISLTVPPWLLHIPQCTVLCHCVYTSSLLVYIQPSHQLCQQYLPHFSISWSMSATHFSFCTAKSCYSDSHGTGQVPNFRILKIFQMVPPLPYILMGDFLLLLPYLGHTTNQRSIPFAYLHQLLVQGH
jgi:hypothetical protein